MVLPIQRIPGENCNDIFRVFETADFQVQRLGGVGYQFIEPFGPGLEPEVVRFRVRVNGETEAEVVHDGPDASARWSSLALPAEDVPAFLDRECGDDATLRTAVERQLRGADPTRSIDRATERER